MDPLKGLAAFEPGKKAFSLFDEFKKFAFKGNVIDLAVGVIIGAAFGKIVDALVKNLFMPLIAVVFSLLGGQPDYTLWSFSINGVDFHYGLFIGEVINFIIVAFALFIFIVKFLGWLMRSKKEDAPPTPTKDQELLTEIRDLLKQQSPKPQP